VLQAGSSELYAGTTRSPQNEDNPIAPLNPYGIAKAFAYHTTCAYREHYGQFATNAVFFTNESLRRSPESVFRKVTRAVAEIVAGKADHLSPGNPDDPGWATPRARRLAIAPRARCRAT
jgi:GDPmannose 4,6-dehydratase